MKKINVNHFKVFYFNKEYKHSACKIENKMYLLFYILYFFGMRLGREGVSEAYSLKNINLI